MNPRKHVVGIYACYWQRDFAHKDTPAIAFPYSGNTAPEDHQDGTKVFWKCDTLLGQGRNWEVLFDRVVENTRREIKVSGGAKCKIAVFLYAGRGGGASAEK